MIEERRQGAVKDTGLRRSFLSVCDQKLHQNPHFIVGSWRIRSQVHDRRNIPGTPNGLKSESNSDHELRAANFDTLVAHACTRNDCGITASEGPEQLLILDLGDRSCFFFSALVAYPVSLYSLLQKVQDHSGEVFHQFGQPSQDSDGRGFGLALTMPDAPCRQAHF